MAAPTSIATRLFKLANGGPSTHGSSLPWIGRRFSAVVVSASLVAPNLYARQ
jgi:hypothetical protein